MLGEGRVSFPSVMGLKWAHTSTKHTPHTNGAPEMRQLRTCACVCVYSGFRSELFVLLSVLQGIPIYPGYSCHENDRPKGQSEQWPWLAQRPVQSITVRLMVGDGWSLTDMFSPSPPICGRMARLFSYKLAYSTQLGSLWGLKPLSEGHRICSSSRVRRSPCGASSSPAATLLESVSGFYKLRDNEKNPGDAELERSELATLLSIISWGSRSHQSQPP